MEKIHISLSKKQAILNIVICLVLMTISLALMFRFRNMFFAIMLGVAFTAFFAFGVIVYCQKLFALRGGIDIDERGITDHTGDIYFGLIVWEDIIGFRKQRIMSHNYLMIDVKDPDKYIDRFRGRNRRWLINSQEKYGTPISISATMLAINKNDLERIISQQFDRYKTETAAKKKQVN